jgi:hypothetical protein
MIDDELSITLRVRLTPTQLEVLRQPEHRDLLMAAAAQAVQALVNLPGDLAGVDLSLPTFEPYPDRSPVQEVPTTLTTQAPSTPPEENP